ncbi:MAG: phenylacetate-CoA ligase [Verrucomicrobiales bacterium]|jgi:phenylacetate-CoA ligase
MRPRSLLKFGKRWDKLSREEVRSAQSQQLHHYLKNVVLPFSKHYREKFAAAGVTANDIRSIDDLAKVPFTTKKDLITQDDGRDPAKDFVIIPDQAILKKRPSVILRAMLKGKAALQAQMQHEFRPILLTSTTGRSTAPVPFLYTRHDIQNLKIAGRRLMTVCDSVQDNKHMNLFPFAPHLAFWQMHYAGIGATTFNLSTGGGKTMGTIGNVQLLGRFKPDALIGMPTFIYHMLNIAIDEGIENPNIKRVVLGGEKVPDGMRRKLRSLCGKLGSTDVHVMATYGFTEAKMAMPECSAPEGNDAWGYHLYPDLLYIEIIDPDTGEILPDNTPGEIVATALDSRGSAMIRYRTGDLISGGLSYEPCPNCGRTCPRLIGRISRVSDFRRLSLGKVKGTLVNFNELEHILDDFEEIGTWQLEIRKKNDDPLETDLLIVHVAKRPMVEEAALSQKIEERLKIGAEIRPNEIIFHDVATLSTMQGVGESLKEEKIIDRRPQ